MNVFEKALQNLKINQAAEKTRMGGKFTPSGLMEADKLSDANGHDEWLLENIFNSSQGIGGSYTNA